MKKHLKDLIDMTDLTRNEPLKDIVYESFRKAILSGIIPVGKSINQNFLSDYLNVSRTPIRIAVNRLKRENLLEETPHGVVVKLVKLDDVDEIFQILLALETIALTSAMHSMQPADFEEIERLLVNTIEANNDQEIPRVVEDVIECNRLLIHYAHMPQLETFVEQLKEYLARFHNISLLSEKRRTQVLLEHVGIVQCMKTKDEQALRSVLKNHLAASKSVVIEQIIANKNKGGAFAKTGTDL